MHCLVQAHCEHCSTFCLCNVSKITQAYPFIYPWATIALTRFIEHIYNHERSNMNKGRPVNPLNVELCAVLERALNYMHSGNTKVIATSVMNPLWIGKALLEDGLPCLNPKMVRFHATTWEVRGEYWPYDRSTGIPKSAAKCVFDTNYSGAIYNVSTTYSSVKFRRRWNITLWRAQFLRMT